MTKNYSINMHVNRDRDIRMIPVSNIHVLNPRSRNQKVFAQLVESINTVGLKRPVTVSPSKKDKSGTLYDLVCGQGRLEAFQILEEEFIPCMIVEAQEEEQYLISLVENLARRKHSNRYLLSAIQELHERGHSNQAIAEKTGLHPTYTICILHLLEAGEDRLISALEKNWISMDLALEISKSGSGEIQLAMLENYEQGKLNRTEISRIHRILAQRKISGKAYSFSNKRPSQSMTAEKLMELYKKEMHRQQIIVKKADLNEQWLSIIISSLRQLIKDEHFKTLLRAENMFDFPTILTTKIYNES